MYNPFPICVFFVQKKRFSKFSISRRVFGVFPSYLVIILHIKYVLWKFKNFDANIFFSTINPDSNQNFRLFPESGKCCKFCLESEIFRRKKKLTSKKLKFPKTHLICKIITKYERITAKTPKTRRNFRYFFLGEGIVHTPLSK